MESHNIIIIGSGPTGLSVSYKLKNECIVLDKNDRIGGLCSSFKMDDVVFDLGGHSFHTTNNQIQDFVLNNLGVELYFQKRDARIIFGESIIPYPFQKNFHLIKNHTIVKECLEGLEKKTQFCKSTNFQEHILNEFGQGICKHFLFPYNKKLWQIDLDKMNCHWATERITNPKTEQNHDNLKGNPKPLTDKCVVGYPSKGGFSEIFKTMALKNNNIRLGQTVTCINLKRKTLVANNELYTWKRLISTIPITELIRMIEDSPNLLEKESEKLKHTSLQLDFFVIHKPEISVPQRFYSADTSIPFHKLAFNSLSSEFEKRKKYHSITTETSVQNNAKESQKVTDNIIKTLLNIGILKSEDNIISHSYKILTHAYPIQTLDVKNLLRPLTEYLESHGIYSVGRFGNWEYINSDGCILRGFKLAEKLNKSAC